MANKTDVWQGTLALMVLKTLETMGPQHGYGIARRIEQTSGQLLALNYGTLYPALLKLEQEGYVSFVVGRVRQQSPRKVLPAHARRPEADRARSERMGTDDRDPRAVPGAGRNLVVRRLRATARRTLVHAFDVREVLVPAGRTFVAEERRSSDEVDLQVAKRTTQAIEPCLGERDPGEIREDVDSAWWDADLVHDSRPGELRFGNIGERSAELAQRAKVPAARSRVWGRPRRRGRPSRVDVRAGPAHTRRR